MYPVLIMDLEETIRRFQQGAVSLSGFTAAPSTIDEIVQSDSSSTIIPESFSEKDINIILDRISISVGAFPELSQQVDSNIRTRLRQQLEQVHPVDPHSSKTHNYYVDIINRHIRQARVQPGDTVGVSLTALVEKLSQSALSSFHNSGKKRNIDDNIDALIQAMNANIKNNAEMQVVFYPRRTADGKYTRYSYEDLYRKMNHRFVSLTINDLLKWDVNNVAQDEPEIMEVAQLQQNLPKWYPFAIQIWAPELVNMEQDLMPHFLRIKFDLNLMYKYQYTTADIVRSIISTVKGDANIYVIASPASIGIVDIYVTKTGIDYYSSPLGADVLFFNHAVLPYFGHQQLGGIINISNIRVDYFNIEEGLIISGAPSLEHNNRILWSITVAERYYRDYGLTILTTMNIWELLQQRKSIQIISQDRNEIKVLADDSYRTIKLEPQEIEFVDNIPHPPWTRNGNELTVGTKLQFTITARNRDQYQTLLKKVAKWGLEISYSQPDMLQLNVRFISDPIRSAIIKIRSELSEDAIDPTKDNRVPTAEENMLTYSYIRTQGTNIIQSCLWPDVDPNRIVSNNAREINDILGIEAARQVVLDTFIKLITGSVMGDSSYDPKHVKLLADVMTRNQIVSINLSGMISANTPVITQISFEKATMGLLNAAVAFSSNNAIDMAAASWTGNSPIGPGYTEVIPKSKIHASNLRRYASQSRLRTGGTPRPDNLSSALRKQAQIELRERQANTRNNDQPAVTIDAAGQVEPVSAMTELETLMQIARPNPNIQQVHQNMNNQTVGTITNTTPQNCPP